MNSPVQITLRGMTRSEALELRVRRAVGKLGRLYSGIVACRVLVEAPHRNQRQGRQFVVHLDLKMPGDEIVINRDHREDVYVALRDAFDAARRQLADYVQRRRREAGAQRLVAIAEE